MISMLIVPHSGFVSIDGQGFNGLDMSSIDPSIRMVSWCGGVGHVEYGPQEVLDEFGNVTITKKPDGPIKTLEGFETIISVWESARDELAAAGGPSRASEELQSAINAELAAWIQAQIATRPDGSPGYVLEKASHNSISVQSDSRWAQDYGAILKWNAECWNKAFELLNVHAPHITVVVPPVGVRAASSTRTAMSLDEVMAEMPPFEWGA